MAKASMKPEVVAQYAALVHTRYQDAVAQASALEAKVKAFVQFNAIGWLIGWRMFAQDFPELFRGDEHRWVTGVHLIGIVLFVLSAILTLTSGWSYFRRHGHVVLS